MKMILAQTTLDRYTPTTPCPLNGKDWVVERDVQHPKLGKVKECYWDGTEKCWVMDIVLFNADGDHIGRESPAMGGPKSFEPAVPVGYWQRIAEPNFPLRRDSTGYRDWRISVEVLEPRTDISSSN
ncbi:hypothetical protein K5D56_26345 [Pseudomonas cichorii]|nr:hypothetical protein [Pseudomonas cichorii]MBX8556958.1 hypothetical protein [Pseudomonas cichorii]MBX8592898.1 hypothetical protein [Pseudomonas cichorii]